MQLASTIGMLFNLKTLFKLMPIQISESKLLEMIHDLCDINVFLEFEQDTEFSFESSFMKDVIYKTQLYDFRKKMHRRYAAILTIKMDMPDNDILADTNKL